MRAGRTLFIMDSESEEFMAGYLRSFVQVKTRPYNKFCAKNHP